MIKKQEKLQKAFGDNSIAKKDRKKDNEKVNNIFFFVRI